MSKTAENLYLNNSCHPTLGAYIDLVTLLNCPKLDWNLLEQQRARWVASQLFEVKTKFACLKAVSNEY